MKRFMFASIRWLDTRRVRQGEHLMNVKLTALGLSTWLVCLVAVCVLLPACNIILPPAPTPPLADYGDAPDDQPSGYLVGPGAGIEGNFPSLYNTQNTRVVGNHGIVHRNANPELRFGQMITPENESRLVDNDTDDGAPTLVISNNGATGSIAVNVQAAAGDPNAMVQGFINVLLDLNQDGVWREHLDGQATIQEWIVQNFPVSLNRGALERVRLPAFTYGPSSVRTEAWARLSLTPTPINQADFAAVGGWDGSGPTAGYNDGETEDWRFPCEGGLDITYPLTADTAGSRLAAPPAAPLVVLAPLAITVQNLANQPVVYVFIARAQVAVPFGLGYFYVDINPGAPEYTLSITPVLGGPGAAFNPLPAAIPAPDQLITIRLDANGRAGDTVRLNLMATVNLAAIPTVLDRTPVTGPTDARLGRILFHPLGPCLLQVRETNDEPIFIQWP